MDIIRKVFEKVILISTLSYKDNRGCFFESYNDQQFNSMVGEKVAFVQDNCSISKKGVIRGMHYQIIKPQGKLVRVPSGKVFDVVVDLRKSSPTFGQWAGFELSDENNHALWIPEGFAHGFISLEEKSILMYKVTDVWHKDYDRSLLWSDQSVGINWPNIGVKPIVSEKDLLGSRLNESDTFF